jgi:hypothetical protein
LATQILLQSGRVKTIDGDQIGKLGVIHQNFHDRIQRILKYFSGSAQQFFFPFVRLIKQTIDISIRIKCIDYHNPKIISCLTLENARG